MLHEYDGGGHRDRVTHVADLDRDRRLLSAGWHRRGYTSLDLLHRPEAILREADETLGRRHRVDRLDPWRVAVAESLFHPAGRERLAVRLAAARKWPVRTARSGLNPSASATRRRADTRVGCGSCPVRLG